jgi:hypothetical protein
MSTSITCLTGQGARHRSAPADLLDDVDRERVAEESRRWIKSLRLAGDAAGTFRERFTYRGTSLWWFTELYLHKTRRLERAVQTVLALDRAFERFDPGSIEIDSTDAVDERAARAWGAARGITVTMTSRSAAWPRRKWDSYQIGLTGQLSRLRPSARPGRPVPARVAAFVHTAFWRPSRGSGPGDERYIGPVLDALKARMEPGALAHVGLGPRRNFRARRWWDPMIAPLPTDLVMPIEQLAPRGALKSSLDLWRRRHALADAVTAGDAIRGAGRWLGCDLWPVLEPELRDVATLQWPWSARAMDEAGAALDALSPRALVTYAEAGGWGRALVIEARRRGTPSVGLQHGFIYRHWLNYLHEPDELQPAGSDPGFPYPDRTLLFDRFAEEHLREQGHLPPASLAVTGSAGLDALVERVRAQAPHRQSVRASHGVAPDEPLVVLAAKYSEVHRELPELFEAVRALPSARLIVKTHPAETAEGYAGLARGLDRISIAGPDADLAALLAASDAIVTRNSTVAVDGLVLGIPSLVVGLPNNLSPFVAAGAMAGAPRGAIRAALERVLYDRRAREALLGQAARFVVEAGMRADGRAAERAADEILALT